MIVTTIPQISSKAVAGLQPVLHVCKQTPLLDLILTRSENFASSWLHHKIFLDLICANSMTMIFSFCRTKQADPLEEEESALAVAGDYRDIEDAKDCANGSDEKPGSRGGARRGDLDSLCIVTTSVWFFGVTFLLCVSYFILPTEAFPVVGWVIAGVGGVFIACNGPLLVALCCRSHRRARGSNSNAPSAVKG